MKAVIMAGGEGTRLRPLSLGNPKPMIPLLGRPVMEHIIGLLKDHGLVDICVTLCYQPEKIMEYFGDGSSLGVKLTYFIEQQPLGTAGSVKACMGYLGREDFLVISGDGVCDLDLTQAIAFHRARSAIATLVLYPHSTPLEYGLVLTGEDGRIQRFVEKPAWGQVVTNQVNTGIYILSAQAMERVPEEMVYDFGKELFPALLEQNLALYGQVGAGYWCDMGDCEAYLQCTTDALAGKVKLNMGFAQGREGIWCDSPLPEGVTLVPPCWIAPEIRLEPGSRIGPNVVLDRGANVGANSMVSESVLLANAQVGKGAAIHGAILCPGAVAEREAVLNMGTVLGEHALVRERAVLLERVRIWPGRVVPAGSRQTRSITEASPLGPVNFGDGGVIRGILGEDIGPETLLSLGALLGREGLVGLGCAGGNGARMLLRATASGITAAGGNLLLHTLECPAQGAWHARRHELPNALFIEQDGERVYLHLFDRDGLPPARERQRKLEKGLLQGECPRVPAHRIGATLRSQNGIEDYAADGAKRCPLYRIPLRKVTVAVTGDRAADRALAALLASMGCAVVPQWRRGIPAFSAAHGGFQLTAQDETGALLDSGQLLTLVCLIEMENGEKRVALPPSATVAAELVAAGLDGQVLHLDRDGWEARKLYSDLPWLWDAAFAAGRICARLGASGERLSDLVAKTPRFSTWRQEIPLRSDRARVMQRLARQHARDYAGGDGLRIRTGRGWVYLSPLARRSALRVIAEGPDLELAAELCDFYAHEAWEIDHSEQDHQGAGEKEP